MCHLGHTLKFNLSDDDDVLIWTRDLVKKANHLLVSFAGVGPGILIHSFFNAFVYPSMVLLFVLSTALQLSHLKYHLTRYCDASGAFPLAVILQSSIMSHAYQACSI